MPGLSPRHLVVAATLGAATPLLADTPIPISVIARTGDPIPGDPPKSTFTFFGVPSINLNSVVAFRSQASQFGVFAGYDGKVHRIAVGSDPAPDLPAGATFALFYERIPIHAHPGVAFTSLYTSKSRQPPGGGAR